MTALPIIAAVLWCTTLIVALLPGPRAVDLPDAPTFTPAAWAAWMWAVVLVVGTAVGAFVLAFILYLSLGHMDAAPARARVLPHHAVFLALWISAASNAGKLILAGLAVREREVNAVRIARGAARWTQVETCVLMVVLALEAVLIVPERVYYHLGMIVFFAVVPLPGLAVARALTRAAADLESYQSTLDNL